MIPLATAAAEGVLTFVPEPKSPHGADVTPGRQASSWSAASSTRTPPSSSFEKIKALIEAKDYVGQGSLRRADPRLPEVDPGPGRARARAAAHGLRRQGQRLHVDVRRVEDRQVVARRHEADREAAGALQHRPHRRRPRRHREAARPLGGGHEQVGDRPLRRRGPAAAAELPARRRERAEHAARLRPADPARRAALHPDHRGGPHPGDRPLQRRWASNALSRAEGPERGRRAARSASSGATTACTST